MPDKEKELIEIADEDKLLRGIHPHHDNNGKVSSAAFKQKDPHLSVDAEKLTSIVTFFSQKPHYVGIARLICGFVRQLSLKVYHDPQPDNRAHTIIFGKITQSTAKKLAKSSEIIWRS